MQETEMKRLSLPEDCASRFFLTYRKVYEFLLIFLYTSMRNVSIAVRGRLQPFTLVIGGLKTVKVVVQRSKQAKVLIQGEAVGAIDSGLVLLVGITHDDSEADVRWMADKVANLRIFEDESGKMNHSVSDIKGELLSISQFTLYGDCRKGRRPNFMGAAKPEQAEKLYDSFNETLRALGLTVETGRFGAMMDVELVNSGPVTIILESGM